jgi:3-deoxy-7-phosphoheptulonate synthase
MKKTQDLHIRGTIPLTAPRLLKEKLPITEEAATTVIESREKLIGTLEGKEERLVVMVGPCSIHNIESAFEYAGKLKKLSDDVADRLFIIMRVYFEKPRTTVGWKGLINDPNLNDTFDIGKGVKLARTLLLDINNLGLAAATELLEPVTPQYIADLITLTAIGARTTESPTHRQMASGLSMPVGYKNGTDGELQIAMDAMVAAQSPHSFLGIDPDGNTCIVNTTGNPYGHLILRGGRSGSNYDAASVDAAIERLDSRGLSPRLMVDCSHANSNKDYRKQSIAWNEVVAQRAAGNRNIMGLMIESNLKPGNQNPTDPSKLEYGVSITDACIDWDETEKLIREAHAALA